MPSPSASAASASEAATKSVFDLAVWAAVPSILWALVALGVGAYFRNQFSAPIAAFVVRVKDGSTLKVGGLEIGTTSGLVATPGDFSKEDSRVGVYEDDKSRETHRHEIYKDSRGAMLVHRLQKSSANGQLYDILIYVRSAQDQLCGLGNCRLLLWKLLGK